jgi:hypothetical protein
MWWIKMARVNVWIPDGLHKLSKVNGFNVSKICQLALKDKLKEPNYEKGFNILMEYFDSIADEEKSEVDKRLKECGL